MIFHAFIRYKKTSCIIYSMVKLCLCNLAVYTSVFHFKRYLLTSIKQIWYYILMSIVSIPLSPNFWMMAMIIITIIIIIIVFAAFLSINTMPSTICTLRWKIYDEITLFFPIPHTPILCFPLIKLLLMQLLLFN